MLNFISRLFMGLILMLGLLSTRDAQADNCTGPFCGKVKNRTGKTMHITHSLGCGAHFCDVWNDSSRAPVRCRQQTMGNGTRGGNRTGVDVDAFTFANEGYHSRWGRLGKWSWRKKGVWTKLRDGEIADCGIGARKQIWCTVLVQLP